MEQGTVGKKRCEMDVLTCYEPSSWVHMPVKIPMIISEVHLMQKKNANKCCSVYLWKTAREVDHTKRAQPSHIITIDAHLNKEEKESMKQCNRTAK